MYDEVIFKTLRTLCFRGLFNGIIFAAVGFGFIYNGITSIVDPITGNIAYIYIGCTLFGLVFFLFGINQLFIVFYLVIRTKWVLGHVKPVERMFSLSVKRGDTQSDVPIDLYYANLWDKDVPRDQADIESICVQEPTWPHFRLKAEIVEVYYDRSPKGLALICTSHGPLFGIRERKRKRN